MFIKNYNGAFGFGPNPGYYERKTMSRKVNVRESYMRDAIVMRRTAEAVEADPKVTPEWKREVIAHLNDVMRLFLTHDSQKGIDAISDSIR